MSILLHRAQKKSARERRTERGENQSRYYFLTAVLRVFLGVSFLGLSFLADFSRFLLIFSRSRVITLLIFLTCVANVFSPSSCLYSARAPASFSPISLRTFFLADGVGMAVSV